TPRDQAWIGAGYDGITLRLDTFNDTRHAYVLQVNPRGVQQDGTMHEGDWGGGLVEDFVWASSAKVTPNGYVIEVAIPFVSLNFPSTPEFDVGFNIMRHYGTSYREDSWAPRKRANPCDICQEGTLLGISDVSTRKRVDIRPYAVGANAGTRALGIQMYPHAGIDLPA